MSHLSSESRSSILGKTDLNAWLAERAATTGDVLYYTRLEYAGLPPTPLVGIVVDRTDGLFYVLRPGSSFYEDDRRIIPLTLARLNYDLNAALDGSTTHLRLRAEILVSDDERKAAERSPELTVIDGRRN